MDEQKDQKDQKDNIIEILRQNRLAGLKYLPARGQTPLVKITKNTWIGGGIFLTMAILGFGSNLIILPWINHQNILNGLDVALNFSFQAGIASAILYYLWPILQVLGWTIWHRQRPNRSFIDHFSVGQKFISLTLISWGLVYLFNHAYPILIDILQNGEWPGIDSTYIQQTWHFIIIVMALTPILALLLPKLFPREQIKKQKKTKRKRNKLLKSPKTDDLTQKAISPFGLWLGRSTGLLSRLWHQSGLASHLDIVLSLEEAAQNILVLGGIGAGKTTRIMQPLLAQLLDQECGGLLFDVKGDVKHAIIQLAEMTNRQIILIGPGQNQMNLLAGLTPEIAASFLKSAFLLSGGMRLDSFWIDTATELCRNTLGVLAFLPKHYSLQGLYGYLFDEEFKEMIQQELSLLLITLEPTAQRLLKTYRRYHETIFATFDEKVKSGVNATVAQALSPFNHPDLIDVFCEESKTSLPMQAVLDGVVYLVDMPLSRWGLGGKVAYTFIKLRFFNVMQSRNQHPEWNQNRPVFFMCDEYQELISASKDGLSDLNFWDKSRSSKTIGIISAQSVSSFYAALTDRDLAHAILQNFRQKICFRTEDQATLNMMDNLAGRAKIQRKTISQTKGSTTGGWKQPGTTHRSDSQSITETRESVLDATLFRNLTQNQVVALLSINGQSMDDVLELIPLFV